ncbi:hypothetical protein SynBIOSU31_00923 [Synechococcus sp. BIOS-U3-1]|uniref:hypothetical protein n=1 Tax=Synechococcus sp. BIOS-U3-1 TaxID=1400865 RepID=UPI001646E7D8|nr:hypothetical protein [Synechococcus sp. BIOS-U3-1]QNI57806.1 hypothetical protein SynBIOSU31_00923 [Synechococcus sp. BIOS-U3-1]
MSELNTDYNNTELLDQELSFDELQEINGGLGPFLGVHLALAIPVIHAVASLIADPPFMTAEEAGQSIVLPARIKQINNVP